MGHAYQVGKIPYMMHNPKKGEMNHRISKTGEKALRHADVLHRTNSMALSQTLTSHHKDGTRGGAGGMNGKGRNSEL